MDGWTALHTAASNGFVSCVKVLVQGGAQLNLKTNNGDTALDKAVDYDEQECGEYLRSVGAKCCRKVYPTDWKQFDVEDLIYPLALIDAVQAGDVDRLKALVEAGAHELNLKEDNGLSALDWAVEEDKQECGEYLRSVGAECCSSEYPSDWKQ